MSFDWLVQALGSIPAAPPRGVVRDGRLSAAACKAAGVSRSTLWARLHPDRVDAAKKAAAARAWREGKRAAWLEYCAAYRARWPGSQPIGFGRWIAERHYLAWPNDVPRFNARSQAAARAVLDASP